MNSLKLYLTINSLFSAVTGVLMLALRSMLNSVFGISNGYVFPMIGINLLMFAIFVWYVSRSQLSNRLLVSIISALDALWVVGSLLIISLGLFDLSNLGNLIIGLVAIWIAFLGFMQFKHNR